MEVPIKLCSGDESDIAVTFPNDVTEDLRLVPVQSNGYRVETSSILAEPAVRYGDVIEIEPTTPRAALFKKVVKRSEFKAFEFTTPRKIADSPQLRLLLQRVMQAGGNWESFFGGVLLVHLPRGAALDIEVELQDIARSV